MHLNQLRTVELVEVQQRVEVDVQHATVRGRAETGEREEVDRHAEVLTNHDRNVLRELAFCYRAALYPRFRRFHDGAEYIIAP